jgi:hypothetical protein
MASGRAVADHRLAEAATEGLTGGSLPGAAVGSIGSMLEFERGVIEVRGLDPGLV